MMNDDIKEILDDLLFTTTLPNVSIKLNKEKLNQLLDYITNLQQENERLKQELNCKEYFSSTMPENTEFVILTKNNYDRQQKDIQLELIDYKSRCEKASNLIEPLVEWGECTINGKMLKSVYDILNGKE